jgi:integrase
MPKLIESVPKYRPHLASGQAVVTIGGKDHYLGLYKSKASRIEYDRLVAEWLASGRQPLLGAGERDALSVAEVLLRYWNFAKTYYLKNGKPTSTLEWVKQAIRPLRRLYGRTLASQFGPLALKAVRQQMIDSGRLSRGTINKRIGTIKRIFAWAVSEELVPPSVHQGLQAVAGLRKGRCAAHESVAVTPVADRVVQATLPYLPEVVADMVRLQRLTGCRPGEVRIVRPCDVDTSADVWIYRPESHKTEHHGRERVICIGPKAQEVLRPYLLREKESYCFVPAESEKKRLVLQHQQRKTPLSCGNRPGTNRRRKPKKQPGDRYTTGSYRRAIDRAVDMANRQRNGDDPLPRWSPNQLRHSAATEIRRQFGLEAAQVALGHAAADITQVYAERDLALAVEVMRKIG